MGAGNFPDGDGFGATGHRIQGARAPTFPAGERFTANAARFTAYDALFTACGARFTRPAHDSL